MNKNISMNFKELEYKYKADHISVGQFMDFVSNNFDILDILTARGHDFFFIPRDEDPNKFMRYRVGGGLNDNCELTIKKKTTDKHNWNRIEIDVPLNKQAIQYDTILQFADLLNYDYSFTLLKLNYVIRTPGITFAYYRVNGKDAYLEIEVNKGAFQSEDESFDILNRTEKKLAELDITHNNRIRKSLFEMYKP